MQKSVWMIFVFILLVLFICSALPGCTNYSAFNDTQDTTQTDSPVISDTQDDAKTEKSILAYNLAYEQCLKFLESPSVQYLESNTTKYEYSIDKQNNKKIIRKNSDGAGSAVSMDEGVFRISQTPVYVSLINLWGDKSQVQQYLQSNNISGAIDDVVFLSCYELPCRIGVCVESEWYFVTIDEYIEDLEQKIHGDSYVYRLYTRNEILKKCEISDADLLIKGEKALSVKMHYRYAEIPILRLFELLGADIQWNNDTVTIEHNEKNAKIHTATRIIEFEDEKWLGDEPPGGGRYFFVQGTEIYLDTTTAASVLRKFGIEMFWSREESMVWVNTN